MIHRRTPSDPSDYWEIFLRRRWWILVPAVVVGMIVFAVSSKLPRSYQSDTLILVDPQKVPAEYVKPTVSSDVSDRLQTISQEILSRTRLQKIIDQFGLYKDGKDKVREDIVDTMRKDITVNVVADGRGHGGVGSFRISYSGSTPELAQQVTRQIASLFIEENLKAREQQAEGTDEFIESELNKAGQKLQEQEKRVKEFKGRNMGSLPEQQGTNLQVLGQYQTTLQNNSDAISRDEQQKTYISSMLETFAKKQAPMARQSTLELDARRNELLIAEQKYLPTHPDVIRLKAQVKALEEQAKVAAANEKTSPTGEPEQLRFQLNALNDDLKTRNQRQRELEAKVRSLQARIEVLPAVEEQFSELNRDYQISKMDYEQLLQKKNASGMAAEMEHRAKGEQFRILDPASLPEKPSKPNLPLINGMGILGGLSVGIGLGFLQEFRDRSIHGEKDITHYVPSMLLGCMPVIVTPLSLQTARHKARRAWVMGSTVGAVAAVVLVFLYTRGKFKLDLSGWF